jgi:hypothetical protein
LKNCSGKLRRNNQRKRNEIEAVENKSTENILTILEVLDNEN